MNHQGSPDQKSSGLFSNISCIFIALLFVASTEVTYAQSPEIRKAFRLIDIEQPSKGIAALEQAAQANPQNLYYLVSVISKPELSTKPLQLLKKVSVPMAKIH